MPAVNYLWDPLEDNIIEEFDDSGATIADYTTEPDHFGNVISQYRDGQSTFFHYDGQGSTLAVTDHSEQIAGARAYTAFGETTESSGSIDFPFQYIGQHGYYRHSITGQYLIRRRVYDPVRALWISIDPMRHCGASREPVDVKLVLTSDYVYVLDNPIRFVDPSGLVKCSVDKWEMKVVGCNHSEALDFWGYTWGSRITFGRNDPCDCLCCSYRQYRYGEVLVKYATEKKWHTHRKTGQIDPNTGRTIYEEDCTTDESGNTICYGHRGEDHDTSAYLGDGCVYQMEDNAGLVGFYTTTIATNKSQLGKTLLVQMEYTFWSKVIDTCNGDLPIETRMIHAKCKIKIKDGVIVEAGNGVWE